MQELSKSSNINPAINHILKGKKQLLHIYSALVLQGQLRLTPSSTVKIGGKKSFQIIKL